MAPRRIKLIASATALVLGVGGYFLYSVFAVQGQGTLAQAPLNVQQIIPSAFVMALDDSGSMNWETLNNTRDGVFTWRSNSFFNGAVAWGYPDSPNGDRSRYLMLFPYAGRNNEQNSVPPLDVLGFARSPEFNPAYFNPLTVYESLKNEGGDPLQVVDPENAPVDPRPVTPPVGSATGGYNKITTIFDLTQPVSADADGWRFRIQNGMVLPDKLDYSMPASETGCGNIPAGSGWQTLSGPLTVSGVPNDPGCRLGIEYFPATFYLTTDSVPGYTATPDEITGADGGTTLYKYEIKSGNYAAGAYAPAIQNFANYFSHYRTRREALAAAMSNALVDVRNMRIGWFWINDRRDVTMRDMSDPDDRIAIFDDLSRLRASGSTPSRQAVRYLGEQFKRTGAGAPVELSCQKNAGMLFTDGYINQDPASTNPDVGGNLDVAMGAPFADAYDNTMADIVVPYYYNSLVPGLEANAVKVPDACSTVPAPPLLPPAALRNLDCQTNLHMNFSGITLGTRGNQFGVTYLPDPGDPSAMLPDPYTTPPTWQARLDLAPQAVDEMWHATLNTRGEMINATTPAAITAAMRRVLSAADPGSSPAGSIALTGARIGTGSLTVSPFYESRNEGTDWYSTLTAQTVTTDPLTSIVTFVDEWEASNELPAAAGRDVWFGSSTGAQLFNAANVGSLDNLCNNPQTGMSLCTGAQLAALGGGTVTIDQAVAYLKGDQSQEATGVLRSRTTPLGDIVNSTPVVSSPRDDYGYRSLPAPYGTEYSDYLTTGKTGRRSMVFAGANDGMLHAFDGRLLADGGGIERFAYIPQAVLGHMGNLLFPYKAADGNDQKFKHRYYVDGPLKVSDAYYNGGWKTVLVGTLGAGGRGAFALDVSGASGASGSFAAADRLWEINDQDMTLLPAVRDNIGDVLSKPVIVPVKTGSGAGTAVAWRAIFGNGYNSASGKAVLFLVDIDTGVPNITMIEAVEAAAPVAGSNGLGNIVVTDRWGPDGGPTGPLTSRSRDGFADTVYAADQKGAIWKFDLRSATPANQTVPLFTTLLYTTGPEAGTRQPILGGLTAAAAPGGSVLVYFGTGSFSFDGDGIDTTLQSLYAVRDNGSGATVTRADLLQQTILATAAGVRTISTTLMSGAFSGWYLDLPVGERFVGYPRLESGIIFMPTYVPNATAGCGTDGSNWLYGLNALSGAAGLNNVRIGSPTGTAPGIGTGAVALNTGGTAPVKDVAVMTSPRVAPLGASPTPAELAAALGAQCSMIVQVAGLDEPLYLPRACGRQSWRQIQ